MTIRPDLERKANEASQKKHRLGMDLTESLRLRQILLDINKMTLEVFDILDTDLVSEQDVFKMMRLPDYVNEFMQGIKEHALRKTRR